MSLQDDLRAAVAPVVQQLISEFPSTVRCTREVETLGPGNRPQKEDVVLANGAAATVFIGPVTGGLARKIFGRDLSGDAFALVTDIIPIGTGDKLEVMSGAYTGMVFVVGPVTLNYVGGINSVGLTRVGVLASPRPST